MYKLKRITKETLDAEGNWPEGYGGKACITTWDTTAVFWYNGGCLEHGISFNV